MIRNKWIIFLLLIFLIPNSGFANKSAYKSFTKSELFELVSSTTRFIENLRSKWQLSTDGTNWEKISIPYYLPKNSEIQLKRNIRIDKSILYSSVWHLYFLGIDDEVEVYLNSQFVGRFFGCMAPFMVKIPPKLMVSESNTLILKILPSRSASRQIKEQNLYTKKINTGSLREILLIGTPHVWISDLKYKMNFNSDYSKGSVKATVKISSGLIDQMFGNLKKDSLSSAKAGFNLEAMIMNKSTGEIVAKSPVSQIEIQSERTIKEELSLAVNNPELWTTSNPKLYQLIIRISKGDILVDEYGTNLGFREITTGSYHGRHVIALNGTLFDFKGVDYIEDYFHTGQSITMKRMERDIRNIKTLGANVVRVKYSTPNPYFIKLCNKYGLFVMVELPVYDVPNSFIGADEIKVRMKNITEKMINAYSNDPSIFAWGIYEGIYEYTPEASKFENYVIPIFKKYSDLPVYKTALINSDSINAGNFDFILVRQIGTKGNFEKIKNNLSRIKQGNPNIPVIFNYGMLIQPDNHNGYSDPLSTESQANYIFNLFYLTKSLKLAGSLIWSYNDYQLNNPVMILNNENKLVSTSGLLDRYRQQRLSFSTTQTLFNNEKDPLFYAGSYSEESPVSFIIYGIIIILFFLLLVNRFKRFREYLFRSFFRPYNFYADIRDQRIISTVQTYILGLLISFSFGLFISSLLYFYKTSESVQFILMFGFPSAGLQDFVYSLIWMPQYFIPFVAIIFFSLIFLISSLIKLSSVFVQAKIFFNDSYTITIWSSAPILILLVFGIVLNRILLVYPGLMWLIIPLAIAIFIWVIFRIFRAIAVVFDINTIKSYIIGFAVFISITLVILSIYEYKLGALSYCQYLYDVLL
ncbi:MAG: glycoside hydrolase family 2 TIM barrel-domain containing protein [bacterium]